MDSASLQVGMRVRHKASGHILVIENIEGENAMCNWHDGEKFDRDQFPLVVLESVPPPAGPTVIKSEGAGRLSRNVWYGRGR